MSVAAPFGSHGQVVLVTEAGNLWKNAGSTYTGELEGMPRLGPSKRCLNAVEALFMVQKGALLLQRGLACDVPEEIMAFHEAIEFLMPFVNVKAFETYMALKDKGFVVRFPSPDDFTVVHVYYMASTFKFSKPREPDAIVRIHGACEGVPLPVSDVTTGKTMQIVAIAGVDELVTLSWEVLTAGDLDLTSRSGFK